MPKFRIRNFLLITAVFMWTVSASAGANAKDDESIRMVDQEAQDSSVIRILARTSKNANVFRVAGRLENYGVTQPEDATTDELFKIGVVILEVPANEADSRMAEILQNVSGVQSVEIDAPVYATDVIPNDPNFSGQYALARIHAPQGWAYSTGSANITIAIVDSGVSLTHPDLKKNIVTGYDFYNNDNKPNDDYGHGTHAAGIAAAVGNNGKGIAGVAWNARIMPVKVLNSYGSSSISIVAMGITYAADHGAQIINLSLGTTIDSPTMYAAIQYAYNKGILIVAASGNNGGNFVLYPAKYNEVIAVGASNSSNQPANFSNYGIEVDLAAPGESIYSTYPGGYTFLSGTSMAAPHVSGLAAILFGYINNAALVRSIMESTAKDIGPAGWDDYTGAGLIQMDKALKQVAPPLPTNTPAKPAPPTKKPNHNNGNPRPSSGSGSNSSITNPSPTNTFTPLPPTITPSPTQTSHSAETAPTEVNPVEAAGFTPTERAIPEKEKSPENDLWIGCLGTLLILIGMMIIAFLRNGKKRL